MIFHIQLWIEQHLAQVLGFSDGLLRVRNPYNNSGANRTTLPMT
jgi:hypothetical protein